MIVHLKRAHNLAVPRLIEFQDPRPYLLALRSLYSTDRPRFDALLQLRQNDGALVVNRENPDDRRLRLYAFAYLRDHALREVVRERSEVQEAVACPICEESLRGVTYHQAADHVLAHGFRMGQPEEMVFLPLLFNLLRESFSSLTCPCCRARFSKAHDFRAHLKANGHMRTPPRDEAFDCYYLINYRDIGRNWRRRGEDSGDDGAQEDSDEYVDVELPAELLKVWAGLYPEDQLDEGLAGCPMCAYEATVQDCAEHLRSRGLSLEELAAFSASVAAEAGVPPELAASQLFACMRRERAAGRCPSCGRSFGTEEGLAAHSFSGGCPGHALPRREEVLEELRRAGEEARVSGGASGRVPAVSVVSAGGSAGLIQEAGAAPLRGNGDLLLQHVIELLPDDSSESLGENESGE